MDNNLKVRWLEALRSGEYYQGKGALRRRLDHRDYFCCLGVLCDISGQGNWKEPQGFTDLEYEHCGRHSDTMPPFSMANVLFSPGGPESDDVDPTIPIVPRDMCNSPTLSSLNDDGFTFAQIADLIEYFL